YQSFCFSLSLSEPASSAFLIGSSIIPQLWTSTPSAKKLLLLSIWMSYTWSGVSRKKVTEEAVSVSQLRVLRGVVCGIDCTELPHSPEDCSLYRDLYDE